MRNKLDSELNAITFFGALALTIIVSFHSCHKAEIARVEAQTINVPVTSIEMPSIEIRYARPVETIVTVEDLIEEVEAKLPDYRLHITDEERDLVARVVMSEASLLPIEGKQAVAQTIVNRFFSDKFPNNIEAVCLQPNQYSTADNGDPDAECYEAVDAALTYIAFPENMYYFRTGYYHEFAEDYCQIGNTYFSCER